MQCNYELKTTKVCCDSGCTWQHLCQMLYTQHSTPFLQPLLCLRHIAACISFISWSYTAACFDLVAFVAVKFIRTRLLADRHNGPVNCEV